MVLCRLSGSGDSVVIRKSGVRVSGPSLESHGSSWHSMNCGDDHATKLYYQVIKMIRKSQMSPVSRLGKAKAFADCRQERRMVKYQMEVK